MKKIALSFLAGATLLSTVAAASAGRDAVTQQARPHAVAKPVMQVYKSPTCGCCKTWVQRMQAAGFDTRVSDLDEGALQKEKARLGVTSELGSCHTAVVSGYVIEGHVPAEDIQRLLREKPKVIGLAAPGMPRGSPGMEMPGGVKDAYDVIAFAKGGKTSVYAKH